MKKKACYHSVTEVLPYENPGVSQGRTAEKQLCRAEAALMGQD